MGITIDPLLQTPVELWTASAPATQVKIMMLGVLNQDEI
jgi:hypothetical protein